MRLKNLIPYQLVEPIPEIDELELLLQKQIYQPCKALEKLSIGWVSPLNRVSNRVDTKLYYPCGHHILFCARMDKKIIPPSMVREHLEEACLSFETHKGFQMPRSQRAALKQQIVDQLTARALMHTQYIWIWINPERQRLFVNTGSTTQAEQLLALLRKSLDGLSVVPLFAPSALRSELTSWVQNQQFPAGVKVTDLIYLTGYHNQQETIHCRNHPVLSAEIEAHLRTHKQITALGIQWKEWFYGILTEHGALRAIQPIDLGHEIEGELKGKEDPAAQFHGDLLLILPNLEAFFEALVQELKTNAHRQQPTR